VRDNDTSSGARFRRATAHLRAAGHPPGFHRLFEDHDAAMVAVLEGDDARLQEIEDSAMERYVEHFLDEDRAIEEAHRRFEALQLRDAAAGREQRRAACDWANGVGVQK